MQLSKILGFSPDYLAKLQVANVSTDRDLADCMDLQCLSDETGIPSGVLKELSELAERNIEVSSKRIKTLGLVAVLVIGLILLSAAWLKIKSDFGRYDQDADLAIVSMKDGDKACSHNRVPEGIEKYSSAIKIIPRLDKYRDLKAEAHFGLGECFYRQESFNSAAQEFETATDSDYQNPSYQFALGKAYLALKHPENAIKSFERAEEISSGNFQDQEGENIGTAELWLGIAYFLNKNYENAVDKLRFLDNQPPLKNDVDYLRESALGESLYLSTLTPAFQKSTGGDPYYLRNRTEEAINHLRLAIKLKDDDVDDHAILGIALLKHGESSKEKHEGEEECKKASKLVPDNEHAQTCLGLIPHK